MLAEYQGRDMQVEGSAAGPLPVRLTQYDLTTAVDILLQNMFVHTDEGIALLLAVREIGGGSEVRPPAGRESRPRVPRCPEEQNR